ncbi:hypothetical protein TcasGA2_TC012813 [Tribolium castaneum]|uniref:Uncharacterized protein n=1 Tax=Tribolium castaneum TaxID=7070 RepID=D6X0V4_TRICA|nr:hypothetical protein TcasGA2_TC012813 [Tribolium castaneum]
MGVVGGRADALAPSMRTQGDAAATSGCVCDPWNATLMHSKTTFSTNFTDFTRYTQLPTRVYPPNRATPQRRGRKQNYGEVHTRRRCGGGDARVGIQTIDLQMKNQKSRRFFSMEEQNN